jgi:hypothetical protein
MVMKFSTHQGRPEFGLPFGADIQVPIWATTKAVRNMQPDGTIPRFFGFDTMLLGTPSTCLWAFDNIAGGQRGATMNDATNRWNAFTSMELQAMDEFLRSFGPLRSHSPDIAKIGREVAAAMERRHIPPFAPVDPLPSKNRGQSR